MERRLAKLRCLCAGLKSDSGIRVGELGICPGLFAVEGHDPIIDQRWNCHGGLCMTLAQRSTGVPEAIIYIRRKHCRENIPKPGPHGNDASV